MNQNEFLTQLNKQLMKISPEERKDILLDFKEHFLNGIADGKTEEEIAASLGNPEQIARDILANPYSERVIKAPTTGNVVRSVWTAIGLIFFNLVVVLGPFMALLGLIFAGWVTGGSFVISPLLILLKFVIQPASFEVFELFLSIALAGLGILLLIGMYYVTKFSSIGLIKYVKFNQQVITGGLNNA